MFSFYFYFLQKYLLSHVRSMLWHKSLFMSCVSGSVKCRMSKKNCICGYLRIKPATVWNGYCKWIPTGNGYVYFLYPHVNGAGTGIIVRDGNGAGRGRVSLSHTHPRKKSSSPSPYPNSTGIKLLSHPHPHRVTGIILYPYPYPFS